MTYKQICRLGLLLTWWLTSPTYADSPVRETRGPWDLTKLKAPPKITWGETNGLVREVYYEAENYQGKPTRVFAYYGRPKSGDGPFPAMVLVHGGGGKAFAEWASLWAERGYVALAMDLAGHGPDGKTLPDGGPMQDHPHIFADFTESTVDSMWSYHAVADVILGHSLLAAQPEVDRDRIGITGISWGGYLTCIVAGLDDRLKVAVPVYGCGFLGDNSAWLENFRAMSPELRARWLAFFDPSRYLPGVRCPILFVNGTNDFAYPLDSYQKSYRRVPGPVDLCVTVRMPHGHQEGWTPKEIGLYVDNILLGNDPLARCGDVKVEASKASTTVQAKVPLVEAKLNYTTDGGVWSSRKWQTTDATLDGGRISAALPEGRPIVFFFTVKDSRGAVVSSPHAEVR
ncbi:alpha/beta hydrolase family protein [Singulisphaera rosea]